MEDVDAAFCEILRSLNVKPEPAPLRPAIKLPRPDPSTDPYAARAEISKWSAPLCRFEGGLGASAALSRALDTSRELYGYRTPDPVTPQSVTTKYDCSHVFDCDALSRTPQRAYEGLNWELLSRNLSSASTRSVLSDMRTPPSASVAESLRNIQYEVSKVESALSKRGDNGGYVSSFDVLVSPLVKQAEPPRARPVQLNAANEFRRTSLCKYWQRGICENSDCNFAHGKKELKSTVGVWKTTICHHWKNGTCRIGKDCRHAHGEEELQPKNIPIHVLKNKFLNIVRKQEAVRRKQNGKSGTAQEAPSPPPAEPKGSMSRSPRRKHVRVDCSGA